MDAFSLPPGSTSSSLVYLKDNLSSCWFLVDSIASITVFPAPTSSSASGVKLLTADGSSVSFYGSRIIPLPFGSSNFDWMFQLAQLSVPILGADYLYHHNLLLNVANQMVFSNSSLGSPALLLSSSPQSYVQPSSPLQNVSPTCSSSLTHSVLPVFANACRLDPDKLAVAKAEFSAMEKAGSSAVQLHLGLLLFTWLRRRMVI